MKNGQHVRVMAIDVTFDFRTDTTGPDPDRDSPRLREYHGRLWSKRLPSGPLFDLEDVYPDGYLVHRSESEAFPLSSDSAINTYTHWVRMKPIIDQVPPPEREAFIAIAYTIGGMIVFPSNRIDGERSINEERGCNPYIDDRFDLTVECIRRHYLNQDSPLAPTLSRYAAFFALFGDFRGYVTFFLLDDLVADDGSVKFFLPFDDDFPPGPRPRDIVTYAEYRRRSIEFIEARNNRIAQVNA
jgi:hypothetical protein